MAIIELFSQRKQRLSKAGTEDVYSYDTIPKQLRVQFQQIISAAIGPHYYNDSSYFDSNHNENPAAWDFIKNTLCREKGVHQLSLGKTSRQEIISYLDNCSADDFLDVAELSTRFIERILEPKQDYQRKDLGITQDSREAIEEINFRFRQNGVGFQYEDGAFVRVDSEYIHAEAVKPALKLLSRSGFEGPEDEFQKAHSHYRAGEYSQAIVEAGKAFESVLKSVCDLKGWHYDKNARASDLIKVVKANKLWPDYLDRSFDQLLATLASALPEVRNNEGGHGQGAKVKNIPSYLAGYALHLAAAKIMLVVEAASEQL